MEHIPTLPAEVFVRNTPQLPANFIAIFDQAAYHKDEPKGPIWVCGGFPMPQYVTGAVLMQMTLPTEGRFFFPPAAGRVEAVGRLRYIDGCSSSLLLCPPHKGDPCINHLHLVEGVVQTKHSHPSERMGMVVRGAATAFYETPTGTARLSLDTGVAWRLPADQVHHFETNKGTSCDIVVLHPDSAWGPDDDAHQMLDATVIAD